MIPNILYRWYFATFFFAVGLDSIAHENALLFNGKENSIVQMTILNDETKCLGCATACPASTKKQIQYRNVNSVTETALFVEKVYEEVELMKKINLNVCDKLPKPSLVLNLNSELFETGYEIHDQNNKFKNSLSNGERDELLSICPSTTKEKSGLLDSLFNCFRMTFLSVKQLPKSIWIPVLVIRFDTDAMSPTQIEYNIDSGIQPWLTDNCNTFDVGEEYYGENSPALLYSSENQISISQGFLCGPEYGCLVQYQIIPSYYLYSYFGKLATCTHMNTVPIWEIIINQMNKVDRYLYAMTQIWGSNIHLTSGTFGTLSIPESIWQLYLDQSTKKIPVPMIVFKIVDYKIEVQPLDDHYYAVIIIHNDPTPDVGEFRICEEENEIEGWGDISNDSKTGLTYVCKINGDVATKLSLHGEENFRGRKRKPLTLVLHEFPTYDAEKDEYSYPNVKSKIREKYKELWNEQDDPMGEW